MIRFEPRHALLAGLAATLAFRVWLSAALPMTADEAYFVLWGRHPDLGFYDHPPMIGWWLAPLAAISQAEWLLRLPATLAPALVALGVGAALRRWFATDLRTAYLAALAVLLLPIDLWNVLVTTDAPLLVFSVASLLVFLRAVERDSAAMFLACGVLLGFAFLSKYFAVLLGLAYLLWALEARRWSGAGLIVAGALPAALLNLYWNYNACWCNVMFNAINRHEDAALSAATPLLYLASLAYVAGPLLWALWRERRAVLSPRRGSLGRALLLVWLLPLAVFALLSPLRTIGLHWLESFLPALVMTVALVGTRARLAGVVRFYAAFALVHLALAIGVALVPFDAWRNTRWYPGLVFYARTPALLEALAPRLRGAALASDSYAPAATLAYHSGQPVPVFGRGSSHARQDDLFTDWRSYAGRDLLVLRRTPPDLDEYRRYFRRVEVDPVTVAGVTFYAARGHDFDYERYRAQVLATVRERYYRIPRLLPVGRCYFFERYFPR